MEATVSTGDADFGVEVREVCAVVDVDGVDFDGVDFDGVDVELVILYRMSA